MESENNPKTKIDCAPDNTRRECFSPRVYMDNRVGDFELPKMTLQLESSVVIP